MSSCHQHISQPSAHEYTQMLTVLDREMSSIRPDISSVAPGHHGGAYGEHSCQFQGNLRDLLLQAGR